MPKPPPLTEQQKAQLKTLEPQLRACVKTGNLGRAKTIAAKLQRLLKATGHTTRWMQNTNWLAECALEAGQFFFAIQRLEGIRAIMSEGTRTHVEATALLALCYIRSRRIEEAKVLIDDVLEHVNNIKSDRRRRQFHKRFITRIEQESILAGMIEDVEVDLNVDEIQKEAVKLQALDENSLVIFLGNSIPARSVALLEGVRSHTLKQLPPADRKFLPAPKQAMVPKELGTRANAALKRIVWRAVCDPNDEVYQAWSQGLSVVYDKKWIAVAIIGVCKSWKITTTMVVISIVALAFKMGVKVFCDVFAPESIMIGLAD